jgi:two-component system sensor histidine kinase/response regulator
MGGEITVESQPGRGSCFSFIAEFGPAPCLLAPAQGAEADSHWRASGAWALILSDRALIQALFGQALNHLGFRVAIASSAAEVQDSLNAASCHGHGFSLVLVDGRLPREQETEVTRTILGQTQINPKPALLLIETAGAERTANPEAIAEPFAAMLIPTMSPWGMGRIVQEVMGQPAPRQPRIALPAARLSVPPGIRVLVADDHDVNREIAVEVLQALGFTVSAATDGFDALERLTREEFDAILLDIRMPGLDGFEVTRRLRADPRFAKLPVIALTAHAMMEDEQRCRAAGMTAFLSKPIDESELLSALGPLLSEGATDRVVPIADPIADVACAPFRTQLDPALKEIVADIDSGKHADAIALAQRLKLAADAAGESKAVAALAALQRAVVKGEAIDDSLRQLQAFKH